MLPASRFFGFVITLALAAGCARGPAEVVVRNHSNLTLSNVVVAGPNFSQSLGSLTPTMEARLKVKPSGDARAWLSFEAEGDTFNARGDEYFDVSWSQPAMVVVGKDLKMSSPTGLKSRRP